MKLFYFSTALSDEIYGRIVSRCRSFKPTFSGVGFDRNVAVGLSGHADVEAVSYYPIPSYPKYRSVWEQGSDFQIGNLRCTVPGMLDLPVLKEFSFCAAAVKHVSRFDTGDSVIVISGLYRCLLRPAKILKKRFGMKIYAIVPDVPELMRSYRKDYSPVRQFLNRLDVKNAAKYRDVVDGFVLLSGPMNEIVNPQGKPLILVDGMCDISAILNMPPVSSNENEPYFLYAGKISAKFGVDRLIEGFLQADIPGHKLYLCGDGDMTGQVKEIAGKDPRIVYLGLVDHRKVLELEQGAQLLIEPRPSDDPLARMSFPSKIIEYMASGTPVLTTNLPCFSEEYRNYQYRIDSETPEGICNALHRCMAIPAEQRDELGQKARSFVAENKSIGIQCARIAQFVGGGKLCGSEETNI